MLIIKNGTPLEGNPASKDNDLSHFRFLVITSWIDHLKFWFRLIFIVMMINRRKGGVYFLNTQVFIEIFSRK